MFDSGVGGLTVLTRLARLLPFERILYIADQAHVPYGGRPLDEIHTLALGLSEHLFGEGCKAVVMACNISSATALDDVAARHLDRPTLGMIVPGASAAATRTKNGRIGVLATAGTVASEAYPRAFARMESSLEVRQVACPDFVPLVERGAVHGEDAERAARTYLAPLLEADVDTVVLGCTHYPYLLSTLERVAPAVRFVDPAEHTVIALREQLARRDLLALEPPAAPHKLFTTGDLATFSTQLTALVGDARYEVERLAPISPPSLSRAL